MLRGSGFTSLIACAGDTRLWQKRHHGIWIETDVPLKFSGESATFELFDCPAVSIKPSKDINRLQPLELPAPAMACGSGSVETSDPLVKRYEIAFCGLNLGFGLMHSKTIAADTLVRSGEIRCVAVISWPLLS